MPRFSYVENSKGHREMVRCSRAFHSRATTMTSVTATMAGEVHHGWVSSASARQGVSPGSALMSSCYVTHGSDEPGTSACSGVQVSDRPTFVCENGGTRALQFRTRHAAIHTATWPLLIFDTEQEKVALAPSTILVPTDARVPVDRLREQHNLCFACQ